jgi:hypothetical protein
MDIQITQDKNLEIAFHDTDSPGLRIGKQSLQRPQNGTWVITKPNIGEKPLWTRGGTESVLVYMVARFVHVNRCQVPLFGADHSEYWFRFFSAHMTIQDLLIASSHINPWPLLFWLTAMGPEGRHLYHFSPVLALGLSDEWYESRVNISDSSAASELHTADQRSNPAEYLVADPVRASRRLGFTRESLSALRKMTPGYNLQWRDFSDLAHKLSDPSILEAIERIPRVSRMLTEILCRMPEGTLSADLVLQLSQDPHSRDHLSVVRSIAHLWEILPKSQPAEPVQSPRELLKSLRELRQFQAHLAQQADLYHAGLQGHPHSGGVYEGVAIQPVTRLEELSVLPFLHRVGRSSDAAEGAPTIEHFQYWKQWLLDIYIRPVIDIKTWTYSVKYLPGSGSPSLLGFIFVSEERIEAHVGLEDRLPRSVHPQVQHWWRCVTCNIV